MTREIALLSVVVVGCYAAAPPARTPIQAAPLVEGQPLEVVESEYTKTRADTAKKCEEHASGVRNDGTTIYSERCEDVPTGTSTTTTHVKARVRYGDEFINFGQLLALTEADRDEKLARYDEKRTSCKRHQLPRTIAGGLLAAGVLFYMLGSVVIEDNTDRGLIAGGVVGAGLVTYGIGYLAGGRVCNEAEAMYSEYGIRDQDEDEFTGEADRQLIRKIVDDFNARHTAARSTEAAPSE